MEKYKLKIQKDVQFILGKFIIKFYFCVIDSNKPAYPLSFIVNLPKDLKAINKSKSFREAFPDVDRVAFAISLLENAKKEYEDIEILAEIDARLKILSPKPLNAICQGCGTKFSNIKK